MEDGHRETQGRQRRVAFVGDDEGLVEALAAHLQEKGLGTRLVSVDGLTSGPEPPDLTVLVGSAASDGGAAVVDGAGADRCAFAAIIPEGAFAARIEARRRGVHIVPRQDDSVGLADSLERLVDEVAPDEPLVLSDILQTVASEVAGRLEVSSVGQVRIRDGSELKARELYEKFIGDLSALGERRPKRRPLAPRASPEAPAAAYDDEAGTVQQPRSELDRWRRLASPGGPAEPMVTEPDGHARPKIDSLSRFPSAQALLGEEGLPPLPPPAADEDETETGELPAQPPPPPPRRSVRPEPSHAVAPQDSELSALSALVEARKSQPPSAPPPVGLRGRDLRGTAPIPLTGGTPASASPESSLEAPVPLQPSPGLALPPRGVVAPGGPTPPIPLTPEAQPIPPSPLASDSFPSIQVEDPEANDGEARGTPTDLGPGGAGWPSAALPDRAPAVPAEEGSSEQWQRIDGSPEPRARRAAVMAQDQAPEPPAVPPRPVPEEKRGGAGLLVFFMVFSFLLVSAVGVVAGWYWWSYQQGRRVAVEPPPWDAEVDEPPPGGGTTVAAAAPQSQGTQGEGRQGEGTQSQGTQGEGRQGEGTQSQGTQSQGTGAGEAGAPDDPEQATAARAPAEAADATSDDATSDDATSDNDAADGAAADEIAVADATADDAAPNPAGREGTSVTPIEANAEAPNRELARSLRDVAAEQIRQGDLRGARTTLERMLRARHRDAAGHATLARVLLQLGDADGAARHAEQATNFRSLNPRYQLLLGDARRAGGDAAGARRAYERVLELDPGNRVATARLQGL
ncbi:MAG: hypothetical protein ACFCGT_00195 [Sandaracinaceae bacterium]